MKWLKWDLPLIQWKNPQEQSGRGGRRLWLTNLTPTTIFPWRGPANRPRQNTWVLNQGNLPYFAWRHQSAVNAGQVSGAATVAGVVVATFLPTSSSGVTAHVAGSIILSVAATGGQITGTAQCAGKVLSVFSTSVVPSAAFTGEVVARFYTRAGQQVGCVASPDTALTPDAGSTGPANAVH
jgi:hypothetical protein